MKRCARGRGEYSPTHWTRLILELHVIHSACEALISPKEVSMRGMRKSQIHSSNQISWKDLFHANPDGKWVTFASSLAGHRQNPRWHKEVSLRPGPKCFCKTIQEHLKELVGLLLFLWLSFHLMSSLSDRSPGAVRCLGRRVTQLFPLSTMQSLSAFGWTFGWKFPSPGAQEPWCFARCCLLRPPVNSLYFVI